MSNEKKDEIIKILKEEFNKIKDSGIIDNGINIEIPDKNNIYEWQVTITAPRDTLYAGGLFFISIKFPEKYPFDLFDPPEVCFKTPIYHLNVNPIKSDNPPLGHVFFSKFNYWKPEYKIIDILFEIFILFYSANPRVFYGYDRAKEFRLDIKLYEKKVKYFTMKYANPRENDINKEYNESWDFFKIIFFIL